MSKTERKLLAIVQDAAKQHGSVNALCDKANVSQSSVSRWLGGKSVSLTTVCKLLDYLNVELVPTRTPKRKK